MSDGFRLWTALVRRRWIRGRGDRRPAVGLAWVALHPPVYTAEAVLQIDDQGPPAIESQGRPSLDALVSGDAFLQTQYGLLRSRSLAERVAETLNLTADDTFIRRMKVRRGRLSRRDRVLELLRRGLEVVPVHGSHLVAICFLVRIRRFGKRGQRVRRRLHRPDDHTRSAGRRGQQRPPRTPA